MSSIGSLLVPPVKLLAPNISLETVVTLAVVNLVIGGTSNLLALGKGVYALGNLAVKVVWIPSNYIYNMATAPTTSELREDDFEMVECEVTVVKVSELYRMLQSKTYNPNAVYQIVPDEKA
jgi:phage-related minor tail protein